MIYVDYNCREEWLKGRRSGIGASDVGAILGLSSFRSSLDVYRDKKNLNPAPVINNADIDYGNAAEPLIRSLFELKYKSEYAMVYHPYRIYISEERPYMRATLDGEVERIADGSKGVWECKTASISSKTAYAAWQHKIPEQYFAQVCAQLYVTSWNYAIVTAELRFPDGNSEIRNYMIDRDEAAIKYVLDETSAFWKKIESGSIPDTSLTL